MQKKPILISGVFFAAIALLLWLRLSPKSAEPPAAARPSSGNAMLPVRGYVVSKRKLENRILSAGTLVANEEVELRSESSGRITHILFREGSPVKQGELLVKINDAELQAQLQRTLYRLKLAQTREERQRKLLAERAVSQEEYDITLNEMNTLKG
ncbi:MAG: biotin/lipoyl-binding protein [Chloroherpetonaceae bacterium]|nr:biotin/lipoyl-binding protein [Chloroherpetonaceae bacterium]